MQLLCLPPEKTINPSWLRTSIPREEMDVFKATKQYLIFTRRGVDIAAYPAIEKYLEQFKERLMPKPKDWRGADWPGRKPGAYEWYEIQDTVDYWQEFEKPKIIVPAIVQKGSYIFDAEGFYSNDKTTIIAGDDLYLLGLLNSKVTDFFIHSVSSTKRGGYYEYKPMYLVQLPIRTIDFDNPADKARHDEIVMLVEKTLRLHRELKEDVENEGTLSDKHEQYQEDIAETDRQIDALVYELYGLTDEEIRIVAGNFGRNPSV